MAELKSGANKEFAPAKINLALHVTNRRSDGYHELDSLVVFAREISDDITAVLADEISLDIDGPNSSILENLEDNLVLRAARTLQTLAKSYGVPAQGAHLLLTKRLPVASGIGGGSADAAATLTLLNRLWSLDLSETDLCHIGGSLGSDVPVCVLRTASLMQGRGEKLEKVPNVPSFHIVLANAGGAVSTPAVFQNLANRQNGPLPEIPAEKNLRSWISWLEATRNDLEQSAIALEPAILNVIENLKQTNPLLVRMSGSGATCFGLYSGLDAAERAAKYLRQTQPEWWIASGTTC